MRVSSIGFPRSRKWHFCGAFAAMPAQASIQEVFSQLINTNEIRIAA
jgi:hypothetical protein